MILSVSILKQTSIIPKISRDITHRQVILCYHIPLKIVKIVLYFQRIHNIQRCRGHFAIHLRPSAYICGFNFIFQAGEKMNLRGIAAITGMGELKPSRSPEGKTTLALLAQPPGWPGKMPGCKNEILMGF